MKEEFRFSVYFLGEQSQMDSASIVVTKEDIREWAREKNSRFGVPAPGSERIALREGGGGTICAAVVILRDFPITEEDLKEIAILKARRSDQYRYEKAASVWAIPEVS